MFTKNFRRVVVCQTNAISGYNLALQTRDSSTYTAYNPSGVNLSFITNIVANKLSELEGSGSNSGKATFALGTGSTVNVNDYTLDNLISDTDFRVDAASRINPANQGLNNKCILQQTITYNGSTPITINEIGLFFIAGNGSAILTAHTSKDELDGNGNPIFTPITVEQGDTFIVAMEI